MLGGGRPIEATEFDFEMTDANDSMALQAARRLETDAAIGLGASFLCCVLGLAICLRSYRRADELIESHETAGRAQSSLSHVITARALSLAGIVVSIAVPLATLVWSAVGFVLSR